MAGLLSLFQKKREEPQCSAVIVAAGSARRMGGMGGRAPPYRPQTFPPARRAGLYSPSCSQSFWPIKTPITLAIIRPRVQPLESPRQ